MRSLAPVCAVLAACALAASRVPCEGGERAARAPADARRAPPNLILITLDTTRADHLGCYGRKGASTPNLDRLAREGVLFENALSVAPLTLPSHATIMTGLVPRRHGVRDNALFRLDASHATLASILLASGYSTAAVIGASVLDRSTGIGLGFQTFDDRVRIGRRSEFNFEERAASQVTIAARELLAKLKSPFFLWVHYYDPHYPYVPPAPYDRAFASSPYDGEIAFTDEAIGRLLGELKARGLESRTVIAVAGDHGESLGEHGEDRHDLFVYQSTQHVPLILEGPGVAARGRVTETVGLVDLLPTLLDVLGVPLPGRLDGESFAALLSGVGSDASSGEGAQRPTPLPGAKGRGAVPGANGGRTAPKRAAAGSARAYEMESFFPAYSYDWAPPLAIVSGRWKYIGLPEPELYDLTSDPRESRNLLDDAAMSGLAGQAPPPPQNGQKAPTEGTVQNTQGSATAPAAAARLARELRARYAADPPARAFGAPSCSPAIEPGCSAPGAAPAAAPPAASSTAPGVAPGDRSTTTDQESAEQLERLRSLGYAGGSVAPGQNPPAGPHLDPKEGAAIVRSLDRARELLASGKPAEAARILTPLVARQPRNFPLLCTLGAAQQAAGQFDLATDSYRRAVRIRPDYGISHAGLAGVLRAQAASLDGASPGVPAPAARTSTAAGAARASASREQRAAALREEAAGAYLKALELNSRDSESYFDLAQLELERMEPARALAVLERADKADAGDPEIYLLSARLALAAGDASRARSACERVLALDVGSAAAHEELGRLDYAGGDMRGAEAHYARALELAPSVSVARTLGAIRLDAFNDRAGALSAFRLALQMAGSGPDAAPLAEVVHELESMR